MEGSATRAVSPPSVLDLLIAHRKLTVSIVLLFTAGALALAFLKTPIYRTSATLIAASNSGTGTGLSSALGNLSSLASLAGINVGNDQARTEAEAVMQSRQFVESFINDSDLLPELYPQRWDPQTKTWRLTWRHPKPPSSYNGYRMFTEKIMSVTEDKKTGIVTLDIDWKNAEEGARWANELVRRINDNLRQRDIREADASLALLTEQLKNAQLVELQQAISAGIESNVKQRTLAMVRPEYVFRIIDPAKAPDPKAFITPNRSLYAIVGPILGLLASIMFLVGRDAYRRKYPSG